MSKVTFDWDAKGLYAQGQIENLRFDDALQAVTLYDASFSESDADGAGFPYPQDILAGAVQIKKLLSVEPARAKAATLLIWHASEALWTMKPYEAGARVAFNGHKMSVTLNEGWNCLPINPRYLRQGLNEVILSTPRGAKPLIMPIASRDYAVANAPWRQSVPQASFKSSDGGKTWSPRLGQGEDASGEYMIRLRLDQYAPMGTWLSPVLDAADPAAAAPIKALLNVRAVTVSVAEDRAPSTAVQCYMRTGQTPVVAPESWDAWRPVAGGKPRAVKGRYIQLMAVLTSANPLHTPALKGIKIEADVEPHEASVAESLSVGEFKSFPVIRSSLPFEYERPDEPKLKLLREKYKLDEVVAGAKTQLEKIVALKHWVAQQWHWHPPEPYPQWDALEILEKQPNGESRGGHCGQYAITMMQCCLAMGFNARYIFSCLPGYHNGHEVVEVWSDEYGKWMLVDANQDFYYLDRQTNVPINAMEVHQAILKLILPGQEVSQDPATNKAAVERFGVDRFLAEGPKGVHGGHRAGPPGAMAERDHMMWGFPSYMPRNNYLSKPRPLPQWHAFGSYWWGQGYYFWYDAQTPRRPFMMRHTDRLTDLYWNLNQVHLTLEETTEAGVLQVTMETNTPNLAAILVSVDGGQWSPSPNRFLWRLKKGEENSLQARVRNQFGAEGMASAARIAWEG